MLPQRRKSAHLRLARPNRSLIPVALFIATGSDLNLKFHHASLKEPYGFEP
jgi:hypothetical protein